MQGIKKLAINDSGQVTILLLALVLAILCALPILATISQLVITQQRLNATADATAMAGALELEFNQGQACETARNFKMNFPSSIMSCQASESFIRVELKLPNTYFPTRFWLPNLVASATAGIAQPMEPMP
jgi:secretion/DNA translocation related TadE-like protein